MKARKTLSSATLSSSAPTIALAERELGNAVDALVSLGKSAAVLARVRDLEARKVTLEAQMRAIDKPPQLVPNVERMIAARIERLENAARDSERVRVEARELIGSVRVIEEGEHIIAEIDGGRLLMLGAAPDLTHGAQELSRGLLSIRARH